MILSTQQLMAGGKSDATDSQSVYQSDVFEQYQWFTAGLFSLASNLLPPVPGIKGGEDWVGASLGKFDPFCHLCHEIKTNMPKF